MENQKIALKQIITDDVTSIDKIKCSKCGGAGNFKTFNRKIKEKFKILSEPKIAIWHYSYLSGYLNSRQPKMENPKIAFKQIISDDVTSIDKIKCSKCGGAGNFKTHENSRRTCLVCFGRGYINI